MKWRQIYAKINADTCHVCALNKYNHYNGKVSTPKPIGLIQPQPKHLQEFVFWIFAQTEKLILTHLWKYKRQYRDTKRTILEKSRAWGPNLLDARVCSRSQVIQTMSDWLGKRSWCMGVGQKGESQSSPQQEMVGCDQISNEWCGINRTPVKKVMWIVDE